MNPGSSVVHLEDLQARTHFVRELVARGCAYVVEGSEGMARVPSPRRRGVEVELMWTDPAEAARWADALVAAPKITPLTLETMLGRYLPRLAEERRLIGGNWSDAPAEPEFTAADLDQQLRRRMIDQFVEITAKTRQVCIHRNAEVPATLVTRHPASGEALPVFADRASAERAVDGPWCQTAPARLPLADFLQKTLVWCVETRRRIAPAYMPGPGLVELPPWDMKALLSGHAPVRRVA